MPTSKLHQAILSAMSGRFGGQPASLQPQRTPYKLREQPPGRIPSLQPFAKPIPAEQALGSIERPFGRFGLQPTQMLPRIAEPPKEPEEDDGLLGMGLMAAAITATALTAGAAAPTLAPAAGGAIEATEGALSVTEAGNLGANAAASVASPGQLGLLPI